MTLFRSSILLRFMLFIGTLVVLLVGLATSSVAVLEMVHRNGDEIAEKWLVGTATLGELDFQVAAFRIAEMSRALAPDPERRAVAERVADMHRRNVAALENQYAVLLGERLPSKADESFRETWKSYQTGHDAWVKADVYGAMDDPADYASALTRQFQATDKAIDHMIDLLRDAAHARADSAATIAHRMIFAASAASAAAILLAILLMIGIRKQIAQPLAGIAGALSKVAAGQRDIEVPELNRRDEIGEIAKACEVFRVKMLVREQSDKARRIEVEERLSAIVTSATDAVISKTLDGIVISWNPAAESMFGYTEEEMIGQPIARLIPLDLADEETQILAKTRRGYVTNLETTRRRKNGELVPVSIAISPIKDAVGTVIGCSKIARDISVQKATERNLKQAKEEAEAGARIKASFVANMSHEIRTPMNAILGFAEIALQDTTLAPQTAQHVRIILSSAKALLTIINDILDVSKLESGKLTLEAVAFHLPNALAETLHLMGRSAADKGLKVVMEYDADLPLRFKGDPERLRQVMLNLVGNAVKFTERGSITISVRPWSQASMLHFAIADTGIGMTPEQSAEVFKPFNQADASTTRRFGGTGLGTTISKQIVELMGGEIWLESKFGKGSTFHFTVRLPEASAGADCLYEADHAVADAYISPRAFKVLLAEDIEVNATLAMLRLEGQGHQVEWRKNGREAVTAFQTGRYDLVLMDVMMPEMDGLEATREIRKLEKRGEPHIPIIALTASAMREDYDMCIAAGMDSVQPKPIDFSGLLHAMEQAVAQGQGQPITVRRIEVVTPASVDFSPLDGIVDHRKAIQTWRDPVIYAKALTAFAAQHCRDADEIERLLLANPGNTEPAYAVAHTLKGVSGNLFINKVAELAIKINSDLKSTHREAALSALGQLRWVLAEAAGVICKIAPCDQDATAMAKVFDPAAVVALLGDLSSVLGKRNPYAAEPILARLAEYLQKADLAPIQQRVDAFDFMGAKARAAVLAEMHGLKGG